MDRLHFIDESGSPKPRSLWVLDLDLLKHINTTIEEILWSSRERFGLEDHIMKLQFPLMEEVGNVDGYNRRLGYQQGFFTKHVHYESFELWATRIAAVLSHDCFNVPLLRKLTISPTEEERSSLLSSLDKMNINSRTLFPDIYGSVGQTIFEIEHVSRINFIHLRGSQSDKT